MRTHGRRPRPHQCSQCPQTFLSEFHLAVHSRSHRRQAARCDRCERTFTTETRLKKHAVSEAGAEHRNGADGELVRLNNHCLTV